MCTSLHIVFVSLFTVVMVSVYLYCITVDLHESQYWQITA